MSKKKQSINYLDDIESIDIEIIKLQTQFNGELKPKEISAKLKISISETTERLKKFLVQQEILRGSKKGYYLLLKNQETALNKIIALLDSKSEKIRLEASKLLVKNIISDEIDIKLPESIKVVFEDVTN